MTEATVNKIQFPNRYDVVGSLLRTDELKVARDNFEAGNITQA